MRGFGDFGKLGAMKDPEEPAFNPNDTSVIMIAHAKVSPRVLVVDDDPDVRDHILHLLETNGYEASSVSSGAQALEALRKNFASIVIVDRNMPEMDGLTLVKAIRAESLRGYVYIVLLTAQDSEQDVLIGLDAGADDYVSKRASPAHLVARLRIARRILGLENSLRAVASEKTRQATTDTLTGANNRRYFERHVQRDIKRIQRTADPLSLLLLDIDHFKRVNDHFGHGAGDEVLKAFAVRIAESLPRGSDWYARIGGEEFAVVLPDTSVEGARIVAERIRERVSATPVNTLAGTVPVTVSIGVTGIEILGDPEQLTLEALLKSADDALYGSKQQGRNRVTVAKRKPVTPA